jgi:hypothetical protein
MKKPNQPTNYFLLLSTSAAAAEAGHATATTLKKRFIGFRIFLGTGKFGYIKNK